MSHKTSLRVWEHSKMQRAARCLMLALADFANDDGICWPGTTSLAKKINESPDYTDTIIQKCIDAGELYKHSGRGRGHKTRFAILCGLDLDAQKKLKGVLQKGYSSTPFTEEAKRGTTKGVLLPEKRGTFSDTKQSPFGAVAPSELPIGEKQIQDDPIGVGGGGARADKPITGQAAVSEPRHIAYLLDHGMEAAHLFAHLDPDAAIRDFDARFAAGVPIGTIVNRWKRTPPRPGAIYERRSAPENQPRRPAARSHTPEPVDAAAIRAKVKQVDRSTWKATPDKS